MKKVEKTLLKVLSGHSDNNLLFEDIRTLLLFLGFTERVKGSHHVFYKDAIEEIINIQPSGKEAKAYQVKQLRNIVLKYKLRTEPNGK